MDREHPDEAVLRHALSGTNDVAWYKHYDVLTRDTANVFMSRPNGYPYPMPKSGVAGVTDNYDGIYANQGGFLRINTIPSFGGTSDVPAADALNTAASKLYYYVVHGNSRNISYDKSDLMRCLMAYDSLMMVISEAIRAYKFVKAVNVSNRWVRKIVHALGWNYADLRDNLVQFRTYINLAIQRFNQIAIPDVFDMFKAHRNMWDYVYMDRPGRKAQFAAHVSSGIWIYNDEKGSLDFTTAFSDTNTGTGVAQWAFPVGYYRKVSDFKWISDFMLHTLYDSTDMGVMQGDIKRAFGENQLLTMYMLEDTDDIPLVYDEEFNLKVHNLEYFGELPRNAYTEQFTLEPISYEISATYRDTNNTDGNLEFYMIRNPGNYADINQLSGNQHLMDLPDEAKDDVDSVILMQLMKLAKITSKSVLINSTDLSTTAVYQCICGPMIVESLDYIYDPNFDTLSWGSGMVQFNTHNPIALNNFGGLFVGLMKLYEFAITMPLMTPYLHIGDSTNVHWTALPWEVENVTQYSDDVLRNMLNVIIESLWYSPLLYNV